MSGKERNETCCTTSAGGCQVESIVTVDERGQMVLPKEVRDRAGIGAGEKLALITWQQDGKICCVSLVKVEELRGMVAGLLGPMMRDLEAGEPDLRRRRAQRAKQPKGVPRTSQAGGAPQERRQADAPA